MAFSVYTLSDPETDELRYVGMTAKPLKVRLQFHCTPSVLAREKSHRINWIRSVRQRGLFPKIELLEELPDQLGMIDSEIFWIEQFKALGFRLVNTRAGGTGGSIRNSPETRAKISAANKGKVLTADHRAAIGRGLKASGRNWLKSPEHRAKIAQALTGKIQTPETKAKRSKTHMGKKKGPHTQQGRINNALARGGKPFRDEAGNIYHVIADAAKALGVDYGTVRRALRGRSKLLRLHYISEGVC